MLPESSTGRRWFEGTLHMVAVYSIVVFHMETEWTAPVHAPALPMAIADAAPEGAPGREGARGERAGGQR